MDLRLEKTTLRLVRGSVIEQPVDAIVNAANTMMRGGGGVDGAIHMAAGPKLLLELQKVAPKGAKTSEVVMTAGHNLPHKHIFHVAGPIWRGGDSGEQDFLQASYTNVLDKAAEHHIRSIAFPSISTGAYGYPIEQAAPAVLDAVREWLAANEHAIDLIVFAMFGSREFDAYAELFRREN